MVLPETRPMIIILSSLVTLTPRHKVHLCKQLQPESTIVRVHVTATFMCEKEHQGEEEKLLMEGPVGTPKFLVLES